MAIFIFILINETPFKKVVMKGGLSVGGSSFVMLLSTRIKLNFCPLKFLSS